MIIGNLGLVTVLATVILTFIDARESLGASLAQALWLGAVMVVMWFLVLNRHADRLICGLMGRLLQRSALFESQIVTLLQLPEAHAVAQIQITEDSPLAGQLCSEISGRGLKVLGITGRNGQFTHSPPGDQRLRALDKVTVYGSDDDLQLLSDPPAEPSRT